MEQEEELRYDLCVYSYRKKRIVYYCKNEIAMQVAYVLSLIWEDLSAYRIHLTFANDVELLSYNDYYWSSMVPLAKSMASLAKSVKRPYEDEYYNHVDEDYE